MFFDADGERSSEAMLLGALACPLVFRVSSSDGVPRSQVINWATAEGRLDVKSASWYRNKQQPRLHQQQQQQLHLPVPPGGDEFAPCPVAESAVSLGGRNPSEEIDPLDDAESPPPLVSTSSARSDTPATGRNRGI